MNSGNFKTEYFNLAVIIDNLESMTIGQIGEDLFPS